MEDTLSELVNNYHPSQAAIDLVQRTPTLLLVGVSGAGKDSIKQRLLQTGDYHHIVSHTTRAPRENAGVMERNGHDYHFINTSAAADMLHDGKFIEAKQYSGNIYGTSIAEIAAAEAEHKIAITDLEVQGVAEYKTLAPHVIAIFVLPPTFAEWQRRLQARYGTAGADPADIEKRMTTAIGELEEALAQPYHHFIINENLDEAVRAADKIAHDSDRFNTIDRSFQHWAVQLLDDLRSHVTAS